MRAVEPQEELQEEAIEASAMPDKAGMTETDQSARTTRATNPLLRLIARWSLVALALYIIGSVLWSTRPVLIPFVIGLVLAYLMAPAVDFLIAGCRAGWQSSPSMRWAFWALQQRLRSSSRR